MNNNISTAVIAGAVILGGVGGAFIDETLLPEPVVGETKVIVDTDNLKEFDTTLVELEKTEVNKATTNLSDLRATRDQTVAYRNNYIQNCQAIVNQLDTQLAEYNNLITKVETEIKKYVPEETVNEEVVEPVVTE